MRRAVTWLSRVPEKDWAGIGLVLAVAAVWWLPMLLLGR